MARPKLTKFFFDFAFHGYRLPPVPVPHTSRFSFPFIPPHHPSLQRLLFLASVFNAWPPIPHQQRHTNAPTQQHDAKGTAALVFLSHNLPLSYSSSLFTPRTTHHSTTLSIGVQARAPSISISSHEILPTNHTRSGKVRKHGPGSEGRQCWWNRHAAGSTGGGGMQGDGVFCNYIVTLYYLPRPSASPPPVYLATTVGGCWAFS